MLYPRVVFIVPGPPATRTMLPSGTPPARALSKPSTWVGIAAMRGCTRSVSRVKTVSRSLSWSVLGPANGVGILPGGGLLFPGRDGGTPMAAFDNHFHLRPTGLGVGA